MPPSADINELIKQVVGQLNLDEDTVKKAVGVVMKFLKDNTGEDFDFVDKIMTKLGGSEQLVEEAQREMEKPTTPKEKSTTSTTTSILSLIKTMISLIPVPILDIVTKFIKTFFGENAIKMIKSAGEGVEVAGMMEQLGISKEQATSIAKMLVSFMKSKIGDDVVDELVEQVPIVKKYLDSSKKDE
jgi:hypothetical protein